MGPSGSSSSAHTPAALGGRGHQHALISLSAGHRDHERAGPPGRRGRRPDGLRVRRPRTAPGPALGRFSIAHHVTGSDAWVAALVMMALADVLTRLAVVYLRGRRPGAHPPGRHPRLISYPGLIHRLRHPLPTYELSEITGRYR
jgi:hypothetical protein